MKATKMVLDRGVVQIVQTEWHVRASVTLIKNTMWSVNTITANSVPENMVRESGLDAEEMLAVAVHMA